MEKIEEELLDLIEKVKKKKHLTSCTLVVLTEYLANKRLSEKNDKNTDS